MSWVALAQDIVTNAVVSVKGNLTCATTGTSTQIGAALRAIDAGGGGSGASMQPSTREAVTD